MPHCPMLPFPRPPPPPTCRPRPTVPGFLTKQGHVRKNWKLRYFCLAQGLLTYAKAKGGKPKGQVSR